MTRPYDSAGKKMALIRAAKELFYHQGFQRTSLENVAQGAGVPLGNVHYYFSTKQELVLAVLDSHRKDLAASFAAWDAENPTPQKRLSSLIRSPLQAKESIIRYGCPHGSLCQELEKLDNAALAKAGAELLLDWIRWSQSQFEMLGWPQTTAQKKATQLVAAIQGTMLLAHALCSEQVLWDQVAQWESWLDHETQTRPEESLG